MPERLSIVLVTFNRLHLLRQCIDNAIGHTSAHTVEIIIWNNASTDGTRVYLEKLEDPRIRVIHHDENIGTNAFARAFRMTTGDYLIELDDDIIDAPEEWDLRLLEAFRRLPRMAFLAANVIDDGKSTAAQIMYRRDRHLYTPRTENGVSLLDGPTGGWCTMTSRRIYDEVGGFSENPKFSFWHEDAAYARAVRRAGYEIGVLADLKVFHASGPAYTSDTAIAEAKARYYTWRDRRRARKERIKRLLESVPAIRALNRRFHFYRLTQPKPHSVDDPSGRKG